MVEICFLFWFEDVFFVHCLNVLMLNLTSFKCCLLLLRTATYIYGLEFWLNDECLHLSGCVHLQRSLDRKRRLWPRKRRTRRSRQALPLFRFKFSVDDP